MKVDSKLITAMFDEVKALLYGIDEAFQYGECVEETCTSIASDIKKVLQVFAIEHMMPPKAEIVKEHSFLKRYEALHDKSTQTGGVGMTVNENVELFKARFYLFLKRELQPIELPINLTKQQLVMEIENSIVVGSKFDYAFRTDFDTAAYRVMDIVADDILAHRRKHPQIEMSFTPEPKEQSKSLIDIL